MKLSPLRASPLEQPALQRLRGRMMSALQRFGGWARHLARRAQQAWGARLEPGRREARNAQAVPARQDEPGSGRERAVARVVLETTEEAGLVEPVVGEGGPLPEPTPEQVEETRRALARNLLKGTRTGMLLTLEAGYAWSQVLELLSARLAESPSFFYRSVLSVDTRRRPLQPAEMEDLRALLAPYEMTFKEVGSNELSDPQLLPSGARRTLPAGGTGPGLALRPGRDVTDALIIRRTVRSGQRLRYDSSVVIIGDVNSGAEVIAGGDVMVWGALRGTVHAGYPANEEAVVCALTLAPVQLRIGGLASRPPEDDGPPPQTPEVASVKDGQIVVESWNAGRSYRR